MPDLLLDLPWARTQEFGALRVRRAPRSILRYENGVELVVRVVDPGESESAPELVAAAKSRGEPGSVVLVAGAVPIAWRAQLRDSAISFVDVSGSASINWPSVVVSTGQFAQEVRRRRAPLPMQKGHARVVQALVVASFRDEHPTIGDLSRSAGVSISTASKATTQLAAHGLVLKQRDGASVTVSVTDRHELAERLAERTAWPRGATVCGYLWNVSSWDVAQSLSDRADEAGLEMALTGRVALPFSGVLSTTSPDQIRCWVKTTEQELPSVARRLRLEPVHAEEANVAIAADPWGIGLDHRSRRQYEARQAWIAHPLRVWCDVHDEPRGAEFAAQLWPEIERSG